MKRIILCLDGTWNDNRAGSTLTNVAKLHQVIASSDGNGVQQISHYIEGIVSTEGETAQFLKGAVGSGVGSRIQKAYGLLAKEYEPDDAIHLFGFSRGAFENLAAWEPVLARRMLYELGNALAIRLRAAEQRRDST